MLIIRLQRIGKKKFPTYRLVVSEKGRDTQDRYLENLGTFDPHAKANQFKPNTERIKYWLSKGAGASATIHNLLVNAKIVAGKKQKSVFLSKKRKTKLGDKKSAAEKAAADKKAVEAVAKEAEKAEVASSEAVPAEAPAA